MTIKQLVGRPVEELEVMSDAELEAHYKPHLVYAVLDAKVVEETVEQLDLPANQDGTRLVNLDSLPDSRGGRPTKPKGPPRMKKSDTWQLEAVRLMQQYGISTDGLPKDLKPKPKT